MDHMGLIEFLQARITEDEEAARATPDSWVHTEDYSVRFYCWESDFSKKDAAFVDRFNPDRILDECRAKRARIDLACDLAGPVPNAPAYTAGLLKLEAQSYAGHPDFKEEWHW